MLIYWNNVEPTNSENACSWQKSDSDRGVEPAFLLLFHGHRGDGARELLLYSNADDDDALLHGTLEYFVVKAQRLGITIPFAMVAASQVDLLLNVNDATSYFDDFGLQTYVTDEPT
jgi:hypothetical protein